MMINTHKYYTYLHCRLCKGIILIHLWYIHFNPSIPLLCFHFYSGLPFTVHILGTTLGCGIYGPEMSALWWGDLIVLDTLRLKQNGWQFADDILKCIFFNENYSNFFFKCHWSLFPKVQLTIQLTVIIGSGYGLVLHRQQAIFWTNNDSVQWCIYASPDPNVLSMVAEILCRIVLIDFEDVLPYWLLHSYKIYDKLKWLKTREIYSIFIIHIVYTTYMYFHDGCSLTGYCGLFLSFSLMIF